MQRAFSDNARLATLRLSALRKGHDLFQRSWKGHIGVCDIVEMGAGAAVTVIGCVDFRRSDIMKGVVVLCTVRDA